MKDTELKVGMEVYVTDNQLQPPMHHKNKLKEWKRQNYNGKIREIEEDRRCVYVINTDSSSAIIEYCFQIYLDNPGIDILPKNKS